MGQMPSGRELDIAVPKKGYITLAVSAPFKTYLDSFADIIQSFFKCMAA